jgi:hypothetical protein
MINNRLKQLETSIRSHGKPFDLIGENSSANLARTQVNASYRRANLFVKPRHAAFEELEFPRRHVEFELSVATKFASEKLK